MTEAPRSGDDDGIDRKVLRRLAERFLAHQRTRRERIRQALPERARLALDALPLLFHGNYAALPGFVSAEVPSGIDGYRPDRAALAAARRIALSFTRERFRVKRSAIQSLFLSGTPGTLISGEGSDLSLVIFAARHHHGALADKAGLIAAWAGEHGLALEAMIVDPAEVVASRTGIREPVIWLDSFLRLGMHVAGRYPIWWLVPPERDGEHAVFCERLQSRRFVAPGTTMDLGPLPRLPIPELRRAGLAALRSALRDPYPALLELMLVESYASDPASPTLARQYKTMIHAAGDRADAEPAADPAVLMLGHIERYLSRRSDPARLALARRCVLLAAPAMAGDDWRARLLHSLTGDWGLTATEAAHLRQPSTWRFAEVLSENQRIVEELGHAHALLGGLAGADTRAEEADGGTLAHVGAALARLNRRDDGCVRDRNLVVRPAGQRLELVRGERAPPWQVREAGQTLSEHPRLVPAIAWAVLNGVSPDDLESSPESEQHSVEQLAARLTGHLGRRFPAVPSTSPRGQRTLVILNAEEATPDGTGDPDSSLVTAWDDVLDFSGFHHSLVCAVDILEIDGNDDVRHRGYTGDDALAEALGDLLRAPPPELVCYAVPPFRQAQLEQRVGDLARDLIRRLDRPDTRYILKIGHRVVVFERREAAFRAHRLAGFDGLHAYLAAPSPRTVTHVDPDNRSLGEVAAVFSTLPGTSAAAVVPGRDATVVWLLDERGGAHRFSLGATPARRAAGHLKLFFANLADRGLPAVTVHLQGEGDGTVAAGDVRVPTTGIAVRRHGAGYDLRGERAHLENSALDRDAYEALMAGCSGAGQPLVVIDADLDADGVGLAACMTLKVEVEQALNVHLAAAQPEP